MFEKFGLKNEFDMSTVGGWVIETFERIPEVGESFDYENLHVTVLKRDSRHVLEITVEVLKQEEIENKE